MNLTGRKYLVVNADDFGMSAGVNRAIIEAHCNGIVTSASLMVRWPFAAEAATLAAQNPRLGVGLHVDFGEWAYQDGRWVELYQVLTPEEAKSATAVEAELCRQLAAFRAMTGRNPTHLDSHQHVHRSDPARSVFASAARVLGIPLRRGDSRIAYCGNFYGQGPKGSPHPEGITVDALKKVLTELPPGVTELACHPGTGDTPGTVYCAERPVELLALCDPSVRQTIDEQEIELISFAQAMIA